MTCPDCTGDIEMEHFEGASELDPQETACGYYCTCCGNKEECLEDHSIPPFPND